MFTEYWIFITILLNLSKMAVANDDQKFSTVAQGCRDFSSNFHKTIANSTKGNIVNSPLSTHIVLSYLFHGSDGLTAKELISALCLTDTEQLHTEYKNLMSTLNSLDDVKLSLVNGLFLSDGVGLHEKFQSKGTDFYNFSIENVDFADNIGSTKLINDWISKYTNNKINDLLSPDDINEYMKVVLVNAIYFKGQWEHQFNSKATEARAFHTSKTTTKKVPTMYKEFKYYHGELPSIKSRFIEIPYKGENLDMIIVLPNEIEGLSFVEENFDWNAIVNAERSKGTMHLFLPKFKIEATLDLKNILREMGLKTMFEDTANFSGISTVPLKVDSVIQKAFLEVNEMGCEAAAATVVRMMMKRSLEVMDTPEEFVVDRPFLVIIRHVLNNIPLFISSVRDINVSPIKDEL